MKKWRTGLKLLIFLRLGSCAGRLLFRYVDYLKNPEIYEIMSAPWYTRELITVVLTAVTVAACGIGWLILERRIKLREQKEQGSCS